MGAFARDNSDGLRVRTEDSSGLLQNSDHSKTALTGKLYFYPGEKSEILAQASYYSSEYGSPTPPSTTSPVTGGSRTGGA